MSAQRFSTRAAAAATTGGSSVVAVGISRYGAQEEPKPQVSSCDHYGFWYAVLDTVCKKVHSVPCAAANLRWPPLKMTRPRASSQSLQDRAAAKQLSRAADERALATGVRTRAQLAREILFCPRIPTNESTFDGSLAFDE